MKFKLIFFLCAVFAATQTHASNTLDDISKIQQILTNPDLQPKDEPLSLDEKIKPSSDETENKKTTEKETKPLKPEALDPEIMTWIENKTGGDINKMVDLMKELKRNPNLYKQDLERQKKSRMPASVFGN